MTGMSLRQTRKLKKIRQSQSTYEQRTMAFMKDFIIYEKGNVRVYINQCYRNLKFEKKKKKTNTYTIRRNDDTGCAMLLGIITFNPRWRQYTSKFEPKTEWSSSCKKKICEFEDKINNQWRKKCHMGNQSGY